MAANLNVSMDSGESDKRANDGLVGDLGHKTLIQCSDSAMDAADGIRVLDEANGLNGEAEKMDGNKNRAVEQMSSDDGMGMMSLVGRVLGGGYGLDNKVEDGSTSEIRPEDGINRAVDLNPSQGAVGVRTSVDGTDVKGDSMDVIGINGTVIEEQMDVVSSVLHGKLDSISNEPVVDEKLEMKGLENVEADLLVAQEYGKQDFINNELMKDGIPETREVDNAVADVLMVEGGENQDPLTNELVPDGKLEITEVLNAEADVLMTVGNGKQDPINIELVLDGKPEVEEVDVLMTERHGMQRPISGEPVPDGKSEIEEADNAQGDVSMRKECDLITNGLVSEGKPETKEAHSVEGDMLKNGQSATQMNADYSTSDIVWGKVKSHPWWPGQIFAPSDASDKAIKYLKKDSYLIAYFGDWTFAWNEVSKIKPFHMNFSEMEKQNNTEGFLHAVSCALDEVSRRVEVALSCRCLPEEVHNKIKKQEVRNAGIREESSRREVRDRLFTADSFVPGELLEFVESLTEVRGSKIDRFQFTTMKAQLLGFNRWKGRYQLTLLEVLGELVEDDTHIVAKGGRFDSDGVLPAATSAVEVPSKKRKATAPGVSSEKRNCPSFDEKLSESKEKQVSVLMSSSSPKHDGDRTLKKRGRKRKQGPASSIPDNAEVKRQKNLKSSRPSDEMALHPQRYTGFGKRVCKALKDMENLQSPGTSKSQGVETIFAKNLTPDEIFSKLSVAAGNSMQAYDMLVPLVPILREFRNSVCLENPLLQDSGMQVGNQGKQPSNSETKDIFAFDGTEDSFWKDRVIQNSSQCTGNVNLDGDKEKDTTLAHSETPSIHENEITEDSRPTALILNFSDLESIPPVSDLNEIFRPFGPLKESETEILSKSKRAKVIFEKKADAEAAFSSTGKYRTFGLSLVSYRLNYAPTPRKASATSKRNKKTNP